MYVPLEKFVGTAGDDVVRLMALSSRYPVKVLTAPQGRPNKI